MSKQKQIWDLARQLVDIWAEKCQTLLGENFQKSGRIITKARSFIAKNEHYRHNLNCPECIADFQLYLIEAETETKTTNKTTTSTYHVPIQRKYITFRLWPEDKKLLQSLSKSTTQHQGLMKLIPLAKNIKLPKKPKRMPWRMGIPQELYDEIEKITKETDHTLTDVLLILARKHQEIEDTPSQDSPTSIQTEHSPERTQTRNLYEKSPVDHCDQPGF